MHMGITGQLIEACRRNKTRAQIQLFELCYPVLMSVCRRYVSQDEAPGMLNLGFYKVLKGLQKYDFTGEVRFLQWARRVVINAMIDDMRRNRKYKSSHIQQDH
ncbi:MAG: sigma factor, partial [Saprospiraceae bacterium]|nr:sigma factor [Saprospiraceae bacterium]